MTWLLSRGIPGRTSTEVDRRIGSWCIASRVWASQERCLRSLRVDVGASAVHASCIGVVTRGSSAWHRRPSSPMIDVTVGAKLCVLEWCAMRRTTLGQPTAYSAEFRTGLRNRYAPVFHVKRRAAPLRALPGRFQYAHRQWWILARRRFPSANA